MVDGLEKYQQDSDSIDLVVTDINMPNMNGIEMIEKIKKITPSQQVLVVSAYSEVEYFTQTIKLGIDAYLILTTVDLTTANSLIKSYHNKRYLSFFTLFILITSTATHRNSQPRFCAANSYSGRS